MILGRHINKYYIKYAGRLLLGLAALLAVDYLQLIIPNLYQMVINGMNDGRVLVDGTWLDFPSTWIFCWTGYACPWWGSY